MLNVRYARLQLESSAGRGGEFRWKRRDDTVVASAGALTARVPAHAEGTVDVVVTLPSGVSATRAGAYTYRAGVPDVDPVGTFVFADVLGNPVSGFTRNSRFVLNADGSFTFEYVGFAPQRGTYTMDAGTARLRLDLFSGEAAGTFTDRDTLEVRYDIDLQASDFENAIYRRSN